MTSRTTAITLIAISTFVLSTRAAAAHPLPDPPPRQAATTRPGTVLADLVAAYARARRPASAASTTRSPFCSTSGVQRSADFAPIDGPSLRERLAWRMRQRRRRREEPDERARDRAADRPGDRARHGRRPSSAPSAAPGTGCRPRRGPCSWWATRAWARRRWCGPSWPGRRRGLLDGRGPLPRPGHRHPVRAGQGGAAAGGRVADARRRARATGGAMALR